MTKDRTSVVNRPELAKILSTQFSCSQTEAESTLNGTLNTISSLLAEGKRIEIRGFGILKPVVRKARKARNPLKPEAGSFDVPAKTIIKFKPGRDLIARLNSK